MKTLICSIFLLAVVSIVGFTSCKHNETDIDTPNISIIGKDGVCLNSTGNIYTTEPSNNNYVWTVKGGTITSGGTATDNTVTVTWNTVGTGSVSVNYTNESGYSATIPYVFNVTVNDLPKNITITGNGNVNMNSIGNIYTTEPSKKNYAWSVTGGTITSGGTATDNTVTVTWNTVGKGSVSVNYSNASGCSAAAPYIYYVTIAEAKKPTNFAEIQFEDIRLLEPSMRNYRITVCDGNTIFWKTGDVFVYKTGEGHYGKFEVIKIDPTDNFKLTLKITNYNADGSILLATNSVNVRGTYFCDLDIVAETSQTSTDDFHWNRPTSFETWFDPKNGAKFVQYIFKT